MKILTRETAPDQWRAFDADICTGQPGDMIGTGASPAAAARDLLDKIDAEVAQAEATPPVDVHVQLRDAKALLHDARFAYVKNLPILQDWFKRVDFFLREHGQ